MSHWIGELPAEPPVATDEIQQEPTDPSEEAVQDLLEHPAPGQIAPLALKTTVELEDNK